MICLVSRFEVTYETFTEIYYNVIALIKRFYCTHVLTMLCLLKDVVIGSE